MRNATDPMHFSSGNYRGVTYVKEVAENMERVIALPGGAYNFGSETNSSLASDVFRCQTSVGSAIK